MRLPVGVALALLLALALARPAAGAMWLLIQVGPAVAGTPTMVTVTTLLADRCIDDPQASLEPNGIWYSSANGGMTPSEPSFRLIAYPAGHPDSAIDVPLAHRTADSPYWDGAVSFPTAGRWTMRMAEPHWGTAESEIERCAGARVDVAVLPRAAPAAPDALPFIVAAAGLGLGASLVARQIVTSRRG